MKKFFTLFLMSVLSLAAMATEYTSQVEYSSVYAGVTWQETKTLTVSDSQTTEGTYYLSMAVTCNNVGTFRFHADGVALTSDHKLVVSGTDLEFEGNSYVVTNASTVLTIEFATDKTTLSLTTADDQALQISVEGVGTAIPALAGGEPEPGPTPETKVSTGTVETLGGYNRTCENVTLTVERKEDTFYRLTFTGDANNFRFTLASSYYPTYNGTKGTLVLDNCRLNDDYTLDVESASFPLVNNYGNYTFTVTATMEGYLKSSGCKLDFIGDVTGEGNPAEFVYTGSGLSDLTPTAIVEVNTDSKFSGVCFNLAGQRVAGSQKGLVIVNGKKVVK